MINKEFFTSTKIAGVEQNNDEGLNIQELLPRLSKNDRLFFIRDYGNIYDKNAIKVYCYNKEKSTHIGYINKQLAAEISPFLDANPFCELEGCINEITGGGDLSYGCNIRIWIEDTDAPEFGEFSSFYNQHPNQDYNCSPEAHIPPERSSTSRSPKAGSTAVIVIIVILVILYFSEFFNDIIKSIGSSNKNNSYASTSESVAERLITLNEYNRLRTGMTRSEVYDIVGSFGELLSESSTNGYEIAIYSYEGYGETGANAQLMFINRKLDTMSQYGLKYDLDDTTSYSTHSSNASSTASSKNSGSTSSAPINSTNKKKPLVKIDELSFDIKILPPDSIGTVWMEATYTNNSKYTITSCSLTILLKDQNKKVYLSCFDSVLPGSTSTVFDTFGPLSQSNDDIELLECSLRIVKENGDNVFIDYDYKLKTYNILG